MAQIVKLKRTAVSGKVPTTSNLELGELAMNTYDGRIFFEKDDGSATIQEILTTNPSTHQTGSIVLNGDVTASFFIGDGSNLTFGDTGLISSSAQITAFGFISESFLNSLNNFTQSAVTVSGNGTSGSLSVFTDTHTIVNSNITSTTDSTTIVHDNDGNIIFTISGSNGELLTVTDSNSGNLLEVNDTSGIDVFTVSAIGDVSASGAITASGFNVVNDFSVSGNISGSSFNGTGLFSGSEQVDATNVTNFDSNVLSYINILGVNSGSVSGYSDSDNTDHLNSLGVLSGSGQVDHDSTLNFVANEHIDHSSITIGSGKGLSGGGTIDVSRSLTLDTGSNHFVNGVKTKLDSEQVLSGSTHSGNQTFSDNVTISGDLTVDGTTTSVNSTEVNIGDNMIVLNSDETGTPSQDAGIEIERGTSTNVKLQFKESTDRWQFTNDGSTFFNLPTSTADVSENSSNLYYTDARVKTKLNVEGVLSGSSQVLNSTEGKFPYRSGSQFVDSGISQNLLDGTLTISNGSTFNAVASFSNGLETAGDFVPVLSNFSDLGSSNYKFAEIHGTNIYGAINSTNGVISGSQQVVLNDADKTGFDTADVSENSSNLYYTDARVKTKLNVEGVLSGSLVSQLPSGVISGSSQISFTDLTTSGDITASGDIRTGQYIRKTDDETYPYINLASEHEIRFGLTNSEHVSIGPGRIHIGQQASSGFELEVGGIQRFSGDKQGIIFDGHSAPVGGNIGNISFYAYTPGNPDTQLKNDNNGNFVILHNERPFSGNKFKIDSSGNIHFNDAYKFPTSDGNANEVLSTDGSGTLSFTKTTHKETVSGASSYAVTHNLNEQYPIVQCWSTHTSQQELPVSVTTNSANQVTVVFSTNFAGVIIVKK